MDFIALIVAALIPMIIGFIYYHKKVVGTAWMSVTEMTDEKAKEGNMPVIFIVSFILAIMLAFMMNNIVNHQNGVFSLFYGDDTNPLLQQIMDAKGDVFRTFKHGAIHGFMASLFFALPILATNALFEQKGWKYIWINEGYWTVTITLMGGLL